MVDLLVPTSYGQGIGRVDSTTPATILNTRQLTKAEHERAQAVRIAGTTTDGTSIPDMSSYWTTLDWASLGQSGLNGIQYFPGHVNWDPDSSDSTAPRDIYWRRDLTSAITWWILDNYCDPVYTTPVASNSTLLGFVMKAGTHTIRFRSGETYLFDNSIYTGYPSATGSASNAGLTAFYVTKYNASLPNPGSTPIWDTSINAPTGVHTLYPTVPLYILKNLTIKSDSTPNAILKRNHQALPDWTTDAIYVTATPGSNVLTNCTMADEFAGNFSDSNSVGSVRYIPSYAGAPDYPDPSWVGKQILVVDMAVKGIDDGSANGKAMPMPPGGGFETATGPLSSLPVVYSIDTNTNTILLTSSTDYNAVGGPKLSGDPGSTDSAIVLHNGTYANTGTNPEIFHQLAVLRTDRPLGTLTDGGAIQGSTIRSISYIPIGNDASTLTVISGLVDSVNDSANTITLHTTQAGNALANPASGTFTNYKTWVYGGAYPISSIGAQNYRRIEVKMSKLFVRKTSADNLNSAVISLFSPGEEPSGSWKPGDGVSEYITLKDITIDGGNSSFSDNTYNSKQFWYNIGGFGAYNVTIDNVTLKDASSDSVSMWPKGSGGAGWTLWNTHWLVKNSDLGRNGRHTIVGHSCVDVVFDNCTIPKASHWTFDNESQGGRLIDFVMQNCEDVIVGASGFVTGLPVLERADFPRLYTGCTITPNSKTITLQKPAIWPPTLITDAGYEYWQGGGKQVGADILSQYFPPGTYIVSALDGDIVVSNFPTTNSVLTNEPVFVMGAAMCRNVKFDHLTMSPSSNQPFKWRCKWGVQIGLRSIKGSWLKGGEVITLAEESPTTALLGVNVDGLGISTAKVTVVAGVGPATYFTNPERYLEPYKHATGLACSASTNNITWNNHGLTTGTRIRFANSTAGNISNVGEYIISAVTTNTFQLAQGFGSVDITSDGTVDAVAGMIPPDLAANEIWIAKINKVTGKVTLPMLFNQTYPIASNPNENRFGLTAFEIPWPGFYVTNLTSTLSWDGSLGSDGGYTSPGTAIALSRAFTEVNVHDNTIPSEVRTNPLYNIGWIADGASLCTPVINPITHAVDPTKLPSIAGVQSNFFVSGNNFDNAGDDQVFPASAPATNIVLTQSATTTDNQAPVTFTATLRRTDTSAAINGKLLTFYDTATGVPVAISTGTTNSSGEVALTKGSGGLTNGVHNVYVVWAGDLSYEGSTSNTVTHIKTRSNAFLTSLTLIQDSSTTVSGASVVFTATLLSGPLGGTTTTPTPVNNEVVTFYNVITGSPVSIGTGTTNSSGIATLTTSALPVGTHPIYAFHANHTLGGGNTYSQSASSQLSHVVTGAVSSTATALSQNVSSTFFGGSVTFTATLTSGGLPLASRTISFTDFPDVINTATTNSAGVATFTTSLLDIGVHQMFASFAGDSTHASSSSPEVDHTVNSLQVDTTTAVEIDGLLKFVGGTGIFTATVTPVSGSDVPDGDVDFYLDGTSVGTSTLIDGVATFEWVFNTAGDRVLGATYLGSTGFNGSSATNVNFIVRSGHFIDKVYPTVPVADGFDIPHL